MEGRREGEGRACIMVSKMLSDTRKGGRKRRKNGRRNRIPIERN